MASKYFCKEVFSAFQGASNIDNECGAMIHFAFVVSL